MIVECPSCGAKNRTPDVLGQGRGYRCAKCGAALTGPREDRDAERQESDRPGAREAQRSERIKTAARIVRRSLPAIHPLLFAAAPILVLYAANVAEVDPSEIVMPLLASLGLAVVLLLTLSYLLTNTVKAAIIVSMFLLLFFYYGTVLSVSGGWIAPGVPESPAWIIVTVVFVGLLAIGVYFMVKTRKSLTGPTTVLTILAVAMVLIPTANLAVNETSLARQNTGALEGSEGDSLGPSSVGYIPDIYYIVLDRYAGGSTLQEFYDFDNSEFLDGLEDRGFYIASESTSNYLKTRSSLASSLNMEYINYLSDELGEEFMDTSPIFAMMRDHKLQRLLRSAGYESLHFGSWWGPTRVNPYADSSYSYSRMPYFSMFVVESIMAYPVGAALGITDDRNSRHRECALYSLEQLAEIPDIEDPTFVFAHMLLPHPPYVFGSDGRYLTAEEAAEAGGRTAYLSQLAYCNDRIQQLVDTILLKSDAPPIIILQADEGPFPAGTDSRDFGWERASEAQLKHKMRIFNAYYLPGIDDAILYPSITPVNSFRVVLNSYFDADLELLPDRSYALREGDPYKFMDVTDAVTYN